MASAASADTWQSVADCESGGNWSANTGNGFYGGLQFTQSTWQAYGGGAFAERADLASKDQQIAVAEKVLKEQGPEAWPVCSVQGGLAEGDGGQADGQDADGGSSQDSSSQDADGGSSQDSASPSGDATSQDSSEGGGETASPSSSPSDEHSQKQDHEQSPTDKPSSTPSASPTSQSPSAGHSGGPSHAAGQHGGQHAPSDSATDRKPTRHPSQKPSGDPSARAPKHAGSDHQDGADRSSRDKRPAKHASPSTRGDDGQYVVHPGDTLSSIAREHHLSGGWKQLYQDNEQQVGDDPDLILPGQHFTVH